MSRELQQFFEKMGTSLLTLARDGKAVQFGKKLDEYEALLDCWLEVAPSGTSVPFPFSFTETQPRFNGPLEIDLYEVIRAGGTSSDTETFNKLIESLTTYVFKARRAQQLKLYGDYSSMLSFAFHLGIRNQVLRATVGAALDRAMHSILFDFRTRHRYPGRVPAEDSASAFEAERQYLDVAIGLCLSVISTAMEEGDTKHAVFLLERLVEHRRFSHERYDRNRRAPSREDEDTVHDYAIMAIAGWALHLLEENYRNSVDAARQVLVAACGHLKSRHELVALWELYHSGSSFQAAIDHRLGIERWDLRDKGEIRVGVGEVRSGGGEWRRRGLYAALLRGNQPQEWEMRQFFTKAPPRYMWDAAKVEIALKELVASGHLEISDSKQDEAVSAVVSLVRDRQLAAEAAYSRHAATAPLDPGRCERLKRESALSMRKFRHWFNAIRKLGGTERVANHVSPITLEVGRYVPRDYLIPNNNWANGFGDWIGEHAALWESVRLIGLVERTVERGQPVTALARLAEVVRDGRRELVNRGYAPNLLIIPAQDRYAIALFQKPLWEVEERHEFGSLGYGAWEGLHVVRFPYANPRSVILADASRLFGTVGDGPSQIDVVVRELTANEVTDLARKRAAQGAERANQSTEAQVLVTVRARPLLGIFAREEATAPTAALAFDITGSDGGYAMLPNDNRFHRPSCPEMEFEEEAQYSLSRRLPGESKDRDPCEICHPERGDSAGPVGLANGDVKSSKGESAPSE